MFFDFIGALSFATAAHAGQLRKWTCEPYVEHPKRVAAAIRDAGYGYPEQIVALLHDVLEDTPVTPEQMREAFGTWVTQEVQALTDVDHSHGNRATRRLIDAKRLAGASPLVQSIKCADALDNVPSIVQYGDLNFAALVLREKRNLIPQLVHADAGLRARAMGALADGESALASRVRDKALQNV